MPTNLAYDFGLRGLSGSGKDLHTGLWHGDRILDLPVPVGWQVTALWPPTPAPLPDSQIAECMDHPLGRDPIEKACLGKERPIVIVDSTSNPTPVARILPDVLRRLGRCGIPLESVRVLVASGPNGPPRPESLIKMLGPAASACEVLIHDPDADATDLGVIAEGIPLLVNREIADSDYRIGIEGIYPFWDASFVPGMRLIAAVLGRRTLRAIESRYHPYSDHPLNDEYIRLVDRIAARLGIDHMLSTQINARRELVRLACGDPRGYYPAEITFARATFGAPVPGDADVVVANAYPADLTLASALHNAIRPLKLAGPTASRILLASCAEGIGSVDRRSPWWPALKDRLHFSSAPAGHRHPVWLHRPGTFTEPLPKHADEVRLAPSWQEVVDQVAREQAHKRFCRVHLYPCAPLQLLVPPTWN